MAGAWKDVRFGDRPGEVVNRCLMGGELVVLGWGGEIIFSALMLSEAQSFLLL